MALHKRYMSRCNVVLLAVTLGTGTVSLNNSSFNPAIPHLMQYFSVGEIQGSWIFVAFLLAMSISLLLAGFLSQSFGKRKIYLTSLFFFILSSILGGIVENFEVVLFSRFVQGFCSGLMIPLSLSIIYLVTPNKKRGSTTGIWNMIIMLTLAIGPMIGSLLLVWSNWKSLFLVNVPIGLVAFIVSYFALPEEEIKKREKFDWVGFFLLSTCIISLLVTLSNINDIKGVYEFKYIVIFFVIMSLFYLFILSQRKKRDKLIEIDLLCVREFRYSLIICSIQTIVLFVGMLLIPLKVEALKLSPIWSGFVLMIGAMVTGLCSQPAGKYLDNHGASKLISTGLVLISLSFLLLAWSPLENIWFIIFCMVIHGVGMGLSYMTSMTVGLNSLEDDYKHLLTQAAALNNLIRRILSAMAVVLIALYIQLRKQTFGDNFSYGDSNSIFNEIFLCCALLILFSVPYARSISIRTFKR